MAQVLYDVLEVHLPRARALGAIQGRVFHYGPCGTMSCGPDKFGFLPSPVCQLTMGLKMMATLWPSQAVILPIHFVTLRGELHFRCGNPV